MRIGDTLTVLAQPGSFKVEVVGIATFTTTNPGAALVFLDTRDRADQAAGQARGGHLHLGRRRGRGQRRRAQAADRRRARATRYDFRTADEQAESDAAQLGGFLDVIK